MIAVLTGLIIALALIAALTGLVTALLTLTIIIVITGTIGTLSAIRLETSPKSLWAKSALIIIITLCRISTLRMNSRTL